MPKPKDQARPVVLYSSTLLIVLSGLAGWLNAAKEDPARIDPQQLTIVANQLKQISQALQSKRDSVQPVTSSNITTIMAWSYPGEPACSAIAEATKYRPDVIKPEYFTIKEGGTLELMTKALYGCNGYSAENVARVKAISPTRYVTVSSANANDMDEFLRHDETTGKGLSTLVAFVQNHDLTGVELDLEDYGGWTPEMYARYRDFLQRLGNALHARGKQLMVTLPPVRNASEEQWYVFRLADFDRLPVDHLVIMAYDYQFDHGGGQPVAPLDWLADVVMFTKAEVSDDRRVVIGLPTYGYTTDHTTGKIAILTYEQAKTHALFDRAKRDLSSQELIAREGSRALVYQDAISIQAKLDVVAQHGITQVSLWHLGGNPWFTP